MRALALMVGLVLTAMSSLSATPATVVVFGDSITAGGALPAAERPQLWLPVVEAASGGHLKMINEGKGGRPTDSLKEFEAMLVRQPHADVLVLALGMNDSRDMTEQCVPKAVSHLRTMVEKARTAYGGHLRVLIVGPTNIRKDALGPTRPIADAREKKLQELGTGFQGLAGELHVGFISLFGVVPSSSLAHDGVHPNGAGNAPIAQALLPVLLEMVAPTQK